MKKKISLFITILFSVVSGCSSNGNDNDNNNNPPGTYVAVGAFPNVSFPRPVDLQHAGDNTNRIFVVEQAGVISVIPNNPAVVSKKTFLDITGRVNDSGNEEGLLGLAFHPNYENNGYFYVKIGRASCRERV